MIERWETIQVFDQPMRAFVAVPEGTGPFPAVVVLQPRSAGVGKFVQETSRQLANDGYFAIAPQLFHPRAQDEKLSLYSFDQYKVTGALTDGILDTEIITEVNATVDFLNSNKAVAHDRVGILGYEMGGRAAWIMATVNPSFKAAVIFYGGHPMQTRGVGPTPFERLATLHCPVLGFFGEEDHGPSPEDMSQLDAELTRLGKPHEFHSYPGAGHGYMDFTNETSDIDGPVYREQAAKASWPITEDFLKKHLGHRRSVRRS